MLHDHWQFASLSGLKVAETDGIIGMLYRPPFMLDIIPYFYCHVKWRSRDIDGGISVALGCTDPTINNNS
jgi:hypothetical protein